MAGPALRISTVHLHALTGRHGLAVFRLRGVLKRRHIGGRGRRRRAQQHLHHPLAAQDGRRAVGERRLHQHTALPQHAAPRVVRVRHSPELVARHAGDAVVAREALVHERVVGAVQIERACIATHQVIKERDGFSAHRIRDTIIKIRKKVRVRVHLADVLQAQPLGGKPFAERLGARVSQHLPRDLIQTRRRGQQTLAGRGQQCLVRRRAPQEEGQARRQLVVANAVGLARLHAVGLPLEAEDEVWAREQRLKRGAHAAFEATRDAADVVELHHRVHFAVGQRTPVRRRAQAGDDGARAGFFVGLTGGPAGKHLAATRRLREPGHFQRPTNHEIAHVRQSRDARAA